MKVPKYTFLIIFQLMNIILSFPFLGTSLSLLNSPILKSIINKRNISISDKDEILTNTSDPEYEEERRLRRRLFKILLDEMIYANITNSSVSASCIKLFNRTLFGYNDNGTISYLRSSYHMIKLLEDSSKSRNYLGTYDQCMTKKYKFKIEDATIKNEKRSTFVVLVVDKTSTVEKEIGNDEKENDIEFNYYLIGLCLPQGYIKYNNESDEYCTDDDYQELIIYVNEKLGNFLNITNGTFNAFSLRKFPDKTEGANGFIVFFSLIPFLLFAIQAAFVVLRKFFIFLLKSFCIKNKNKNNKEIQEQEKNEDNLEDSMDNDEERVSYIRTKKTISPEDDDKLESLYKIIECFNFIENQNELFNFSLTSTKYNNDSGLSNIRGIIGISLIFMLIGWTFMALYNSFSKVYTPYSLTNFFQKEFYMANFIMIGIRYSPRIIISCSGYLLIYKYISFLDKNIISNSEGILSFFLTFIFYQSHKYILLILLLLFQRYSIYYIYNFFAKEMPLWKYFHIRILKQPSTLWFYLSFTLVKSFIPVDEETKRRGNNLLDYFWLPFNEIIFFIFGVILITIGFKKKYRIDKFILIATPICFFLKILLSFFTFFDNFEDSRINKYYSTAYYLFFNYGGFMIHPIFNLPYYLIGMYFGLMNYTIQKGIFSLNKSYIYSHFDEKLSSDYNLRKDSDENEFSHEDSDECKDEENEEKKKEYCQEVTKMPFLISPIIFVKWHRRKEFKKLLILLAVFFFIFLIFVFYYTILIKTTDNISTADENPIVNFIYRIDIEFVILFVQWGSFIIFLKANNFAAIFLSHVAWTMLSKPYFSFILIINTVLLFIFFHNETLIEINAVNIFLYSIIGGSVTFILTCLFYIFFELPYKKLVHLLYPVIFKINDNPDDNDINSNDGDEKNNENDEKNDEDDENENIEEKNELY